MEADWIARFYIERLKHKMYIVIYKLSHMIQPPLILLCSLTMLIGVVQGQTNEKQYIGRYGHNDGVCLFEDG